MSDELLEFLGIAAGGIAIYLVAQNNAPAIKKAVSSIPAVSNIIPVSTRAPQDDRAPAPRGTCPPGYSPDYTMGVMHCHDSHGTRELNPNVKMFNPQWQNAWGDEGWTSPPLIPTPSQTLAPPKPEPQTLREPSRIISSVNPQIKKSEEKEKKVHTQVECPKDLNTMKCGSNCYKNGKLYKIVCSEAEREALYPPKKTKKKSITVPANFPSDVTISPGETPYPEVGDTPGGADVPIPPLQLAPGQQPIKPTIPPGAPGQAPTPSAPAPQLQPIQTGPGKAVGRSNCGGCNTKDGYPSCRCAIGSECNGKKSSEDGGQDGVKVSDLIGNSSSFYAVWDFHGGGWHPGGKGGDGAEVTAAYCGSNNNYKQVGITIGVYHDGKIKTRTEDHYAPGGHQRASGDFMDLSNGLGIKSVPGFPANDFTIIWCADKDASGVLYRGYMKVGKRGNGPDTRKEIQIANIRNPREGGDGSGRHDSRTNIIDFTKQANTYMRGRIDKAGMNATATGTLYPGHYTPGSGFYYNGELGYMLENDGYF